MAAVSGAGAKRRQEGSPGAPGSAEAAGEAGGAVKRPRASAGAAAAALGDAETAELLALRKANQELRSQNDGYRSQIGALEAQLLEKDNAHEQHLAVQGDKVRGGRVAAAAAAFTASRAAPCFCFR